MRRRFLRAMAALAALSPLRAFAQREAAQSEPEVEYERVRPRVLRFPQDHGAHPNFRTEWWYVTGWLDDGRGFQLTFFRHRPGVAERSRSAFAARQLVFAHAALSDPARGALLHDQRIARAGMGLAGAEEGGMRIWIGDWRLEAQGDVYRADLPAEDFRLELELRPTQPVLLQGEEGVSRKGPHPDEASHYYSMPQLEVRGAVTVKKERRAVTGRAWFDHEWSSQYLGSGAAGWDWLGLDFHDGSALMAFRMRKGNKSNEEGIDDYWTDATLRDAQGRRATFDGSSKVRFTPLRWWTSPRTGTRYPVSMRVQVGDLDLRLEPLMDDQELDSRATTRTIYWEGAVRAFVGEREVGRGYLELTGYWQRDVSAALRVPAQA